jgi:hypothetical protein
MIGFAALEIKNPIVYEEINVIALQYKKCCNAPTGESEARHDGCRILQKASRKVRHFGEADSR